MVSSKTTSSFFYLNITQFLAALNDNLYKLLLVFFLIDQQGIENSNTILSLVGAIFVIPFVLFTSTAGTFADRYSKRSIICLTRGIEIGVAVLGFFAFLFGWDFGGYLVLFLMAMQSAIFSPCKYGILPEIVHKNRLSHCNGVMSASTYLAIIIGTFLASFFTQITHKNFPLIGLLIVLIAVAGALTSLKIEKTKPQSAHKKISYRFIYVIYQTLKKARNFRYLLVTLIFGAYFLFIGAYTQLNMIPFALQSLGLSEVQGGYLFLMTAIGIGIGSFFAGRLSGRGVELGFIPLAALGLSLNFLFLQFFATHFFFVSFILFFIGISGGFYIVPIDAFIQTASPDEDRGQNVAASNFLSFTGVIFASFCIGFFGNTLGLKASEGFFIVGLFTFCIFIFLLFAYADQVLRLVASTLCSIFFHLRIQRRGKLDSKGAKLLIAPRSSWIDTALVMASLPRLIRYLLPLDPSKKKAYFFYKLLRFIPIELDPFSPLSIEALYAIEKEIKQGHSVCLMYPVSSKSQQLENWVESLEKITQNLNVPIIPLYLKRARISNLKGFWKQLKTLRSKNIYVKFGNSFQKPSSQ